MNELKGDPIPRAEHEALVRELNAIIAALVLKFGGGHLPLYEDDLRDTVGHALFIDHGRPLSGLTIRVESPEVSELPAITHILPRTYQ
jgi:hypothetical protein